MRSYLFENVTQIGSNKTRFGIVVLAILLAGIAGRYASASVLLIAAAAIGAVLFSQKPIIGIYVSIIIALFVPVDIGTGTEVALNPVTLFIPGLCALWLANLLARRCVHFVPSQVNRPLLLFIASIWLALFVGNALWDASVPRSSSFIFTQLGQLAIYTLSAVAFWLVANLAKNEIDLQRIGNFFIIIAGAIALLRLSPLWGYIDPLLTIAYFRTPFWICLGSLTGGQLLFNHQLSRRWRLYLVAVFVAVLMYAFQIEADRTSNWVAVGVVVYALTWLRLPRWRLPLAAIAILAATVFFPQVYEFGGGDVKWTESGASRLVLTNRVIQLTARDPIFGLGPAAYRQYGFIEPLQYGHSVWVRPNISSHNNYVDIYAQAGILGLAFFMWFMVELARLGARQRGRFRSGFSAGYVNGMLAAIASICAAMLLLDWFLPFVYNVGFPGFQASVLLWMFLGGLVALENMGQRELPSKANHAA